MNKFLLLILIVSNNLFAGYGEFFGPGSTSAARGNQGSLLGREANTNFHTPALISKNDSLTLEVNSMATLFNFNPIENVINQNSTNSTTTTTGNADTDYSELLMSSIHLIVPIKDLEGAIGVSLFSPMFYVAEFNSGHSYMPEYVMYRSRLSRLQAHINYSQPINDEWSFSVGTQIGFGVDTELTANASLNGTNYPSSSEARAKVFPKLGAIVSVAKINEKSAYAFTYLQELKSTVEATVLGETSDLRIIFDLKSNALLYYDPHTFRLSSEHDFDFLKLHLEAEYQLWKNYETPRINLIQMGSVLSSQNFEQMDLRNIFLLKAGTTLSLRDQLAVNAGVSYRQSPLQGDFSGSGNSLDTDYLSIHLGGSLTTTLFSKEIKLSAGLQHHLLKEIQVTKTAGQENGNNGTKIGSPGYTIGGSTTSISLGAGVEF